MPTKKEPHNRHYLPDETQANHYLTHAAQKAKISMIATPIGNLSDISPRVEQLFMSVDEIWCEDTRHTQALLHALNIEKRRLKRVDQHTTDAEMIRLLEGVAQGGQHIGVVSDAGTPGLSDPGAKISDLILQFPSIRLEPIPGPSAVSAFVSIAGLSGNSFLFQGFFPRSESDGLELLNHLKDAQVSPNWIFFESPNRIRETLGVLLAWAKTLEFNPKFVLAKEISKIHETLYLGEGQSFLQWLQGQAFDERGEWVLGVVIPKDCVKIKKDEAEWQLTLECLIDAGISTKDSAQIVAGRFSVAKKLAYQSALEYQKKLN